MIITICGSMMFHRQMAMLQKQLEDMGHSVLVPSNIDDPDRNEAYMETDEERILLKIEYDLVREHFKKIQEADAILVVNYPKKGIDSYIGGNTFLEMGVAFWLNKIIFVLHHVPEMDYKTEMMALQPIELHGDIANISNVSADISL